jgi:hypothetical protein
MSDCVPPCQARYPDCIIRRSANRNSVAIFERSDPSRKISIETIVGTAVPDFSQATNVGDKGPICMSSSGAELRKKTTPLGLVLVLSIEHGDDSLREDFYALPLLAKSLEKFKANQHPELVRRRESRLCPPGCKMIHCPLLNRVEVVSARRGYATNALPVKTNFAKSPGHTR